MPSSANLLEVFQLAERSEVAGGAFYRQAAERAGREETKQFFRSLAQQEDAHRRTFARMKRRIAERRDAVPGDDDPVVSRYLRAVAGDFLFNQTQAVEDVLSGEETLEDILWLAIGREKDSIVLFLGIIDALKVDQDRRAIELILNEEQQHLAELTHQLESLPASETD